MGSVDEINREHGGEDYATYLKKARESHGFDVGPHPGLRIPGGIVAFDLENMGHDDIEELNDLCKQAMQKYNEKEKTNYGFVKIVKVNGQSVAGRMYYLTYEAKDVTDPSNEACNLTFQAKVFVNLGDEGIEVELCRIKPTS